MGTAAEESACLCLCWRQGACDECCLFVCKIRQKLQGSISLILLEQWKRNKSFFKIAREVKDKSKSLG